MAAMPTPFLEAWARTAWESRNCGVRAGARAPFFGARVRGACGHGVCVDVRARAAGAVGARCEGARAASAGACVRRAGACVRREGASAETANFS